VLALRHRLIGVMVRVHKISRALAIYHVSQMTNAELSWRLSKYTEMELSVVGPKAERSNVFSTRFSRPATMTACPQHSAPFPSSRPEQEKRAKSCQIRR
jgi:hypothetical protein